MKRITAFFAVLLILLSALLYNINRLTIPAAAYLTAPGTVVIDAGHGGEDGGATSGSVRESELNLAVARRLEATLGLFAVKSVMTRNSEEIAYPAEAKTTRERKRADQKARAELINSCGATVLISIHQNKYPDTAPRGAQVLYSGTEGSQQLAELMQGSLVDELDADNRRSAAKIPNDIFLMRSVSCTAVLVECGFMSNPSELTLLTDDVYQQQIAAILAASYLQYELSAEENGNGKG